MNGFAILAHVPGGVIVGSDTGTLAWVADELAADDYWRRGFLSDRIQVVKVTKAPALFIPDWKPPADDAPESTTVSARRVTLNTYDVCGWLIRAGFDAPTITWLVSGILQPAASGD